MARKMITGTNSIKPVVLHFNGKQPMKLLALITLSILYLFSSASKASPDILETKEWIKQHLDKNGYARVSTSWYSKPVYYIELSSIGKPEWFGFDDEECSLILKEFALWYEASGRPFNKKNFPPLTYPDYMVLLHEFSNQTYMSLSFPFELTFEYDTPRIDEVDGDEDMDGFTEKYHNYSLNISGNSVKLIYLTNAEAVIKESAKKIWGKMDIRTNTVSVAINTKENGKRLESAIKNINQKCQQKSELF